MPREVEHEVLGGVVLVQEGSDLVDAVGVRGVFMGE